MVLVEGADTLALFNYLLNCHSCVASTGVQAGLPPTLLASVAFKGATLETLKVAVINSNICLCIWNKKQHCLLGFLESQWICHHDLFLMMITVVATPTAWFKSFPSLDLASPQQVIHLPRVESFTSPGIDTR